MRLLRPYQQCAGVDYDLEKLKFINSAAVLRTHDKAMVKAIAFLLAPKGRKPRVYSWMNER